VLQLENKTPFAAAINLFQDAKGLDTLYVTLKATFSIAESEPLVAEEQVSVQQGDEYWGEPGESSIKYASEAHLTKPSTDVVLVGSARVPDGQSVQRLDTLVSVGPVKKQVTVFGDRVWTGRSLGGYEFTDPEPFESMPLTWERAYGGKHVPDPEKDTFLAEWRNPVGCGFKGKRGRGDMTGQPVPNLEDPSKRLSKPGGKQTPSCFAYVAPGWQQRAQYAGTYDAAWQKNRAPYLPDDFDPRFFNCAPEGLICPTYLQGGEPVDLVGVSPLGPLHFLLPVCETTATIHVAGRTESPPLLLETVLLEPDESRFSMQWRAAMQCDKEALRVERVELDVAQLELAGGVA
jgi:hypothetical protein